MLLRCDWLVFNSCDWCISILAVSVSCCSPSGPLSHSSPVVVFFDRRHPCFRNFNSIIPVDIIRVKSYVNCLFDPTFVPVWVAINKLYLIPKLMELNHIKTTCSVNRNLPVSVRWMVISSAVHRLSNEESRNYHSQLHFRLLMVCISSSCSS